MSSTTSTSASTETNISTPAQPSGGEPAATLATPATPRVQATHRVPTIRQLPPSAVAPAAPAIRQLPSAGAMRAQAVKVRAAQKLKELLQSEEEASIDAEAERLAQNLLRARRGPRTRPSSRHVEDDNESVYSARESCQGERRRRFNYCAPDNACPPSCFPPMCVPPPPPCGPCGPCGPYGPYGPYGYGPFSSFSPYGVVPYGLPTATGFTTQVSTLCGPGGGCSLVSQPQVTTCSPLGCASVPAGPPNLVPTFFS